MTSSVKIHFKALTSLRFFAAMHVLAFHNHLDVLTASPPAIRNIIRTGYVSVSMFFVLSGFILAYTYLSGREPGSFDRRSFWWARVARIYPVYLVGLILAGPLVFWSHFNSERPMWSAFKISVMGGSCCTLTQSWIPPLALVWNSPGWSLSAEAFFYLLFPLVGPFIWRLNRRQTVISLAGFWLLSLAPPLICWFAPVPGFSDCSATEPPSSTWLTKLVAFNPLLRLPEFLLGIALSRLFVLNQQGRLFLRFPSASRFMPSAALVGILGLLTCGSWISYPFLHNGLLDILFAVLIYGLAREGTAQEIRNPKSEIRKGWLWMKHRLNTEGNPCFIHIPSVALFRISNVGFRVSDLIPRIPTLPLLVLLGEASYAIYILHVPLRTWMYQLLGWLHPGIQPSLPLFLAYTVVTLGISLLVFKGIEEPARRLIRQRRLCLSA